MTDVDETRPDTAYSTFFTGPEDIEENHGRAFVVPQRDSKDRCYLLPMDKEEVVRQQFGHPCWMNTYMLIVAPRFQVPSGTVLDLGSGAGLWVQDLANVRPDTRIIGIDLYFIDPPETPNMSPFEVDDCELDLVHRQVALVKKFV